MLRAHWHKFWKLWWCCFFSPLRLRRDLWGLVLLWPFVVGSSILLFWKLIHVFRTRLTAAQNACFTIDSLVSNPISSSSFFLPLSGSYKYTSVCPKEIRKIVKCLVNVFQDKSLNCLFKKSHESFNFSKTFAFWCKICHWFVSNSSLWKSWTQWRSNWVDDLLTHKTRKTSSFNLDMNFLSNYSRVKIFHNYGSFRKT